MRVIRRDAYLDQLIGCKGNGLIKVITGARRCGKSFLLFYLFYRHLLESGIAKDHIIRIAFDDWGNKDLRDPDHCYEYVRSLVNKGGGKGEDAGAARVAEIGGSSEGTAEQQIVNDADTYYILLDEVQYMRDFEDVLNGFLHFGNVDVYVTGSNSRFLSTDVITEFRGRGDEIHVYPLNFAEYFSAVRDDRQGADWRDAWNQYSVFGGLPLVLDMPTDAAKTAYLKNLVAQTYLRDIIERNAIRNETGLNELISIIASSIGSLTNPSRIANTFKSVAGVALSEPTVSTYLKYLEEAFVVESAQRYDVKGRKYIGAQRKYYFEDIGVRNAVLNFRQQETTHIMENVLFNELRCRGYNVDVGVVDVSEVAGGKNVHRRTEVDFVANLGSKRFYIQSALALPDERKRAQEVRPLLALDDSFRKVVIVGGDVVPYYDEHGVLTLGLKDFLLEPGSMEQ